jgi:formylglycine-generating enzyme required for sulfatase activity
MMHECLNQRVSSKKAFVVQCRAGVTTQKTSIYCELIMKTKLRSTLIALALIAGVRPAAQAAQFFRISGPAMTKITAFRSDGTMVWSNAQPGATFTVQTLSAFPGGTNWVDYVKIPTTNSVNTNLLMAFNPPSGMVLVPAGSYTMGNSIGDSDITDANTNGVYLSAFYLDSNSVTYGLWLSVHDWATNHGYIFDDAGMGKASNNPVQTVNWYDCVKWCNARSEMASLTPCYYTTSIQTTVYRAGDIDLGNSSVKWTVKGYRLPTEAEWEKAARGGLSGQRFPWGDIISESRANYQGYTGYSYDMGPTEYNPLGTNGGMPYTCPVGSFAPNGYGLYDTAGNIYDWCWDWYATPYAGGTDPLGPASGSARTFRGGCWSLTANYDRTAARRDFAATTTGDGLGFRCALSPGP